MNVVERSEVMNQALEQNNNALRIQDEKDRKAMQEGLIKERNEWNNFFYFAFNFRIEKERSR